MEDAADAAPSNHLDHAALVVDSLDRATSFYSRLLGLPVLERVTLPNHSIQYLAAGSDVRLELISYHEEVDAPQGRRVGIPEPHHLAWLVSDLEGHAPRVIALGGSIVSPPVFMPELGQTSLLIRDLDGFLIELVER